MSSRSPRRARVLPACALAVLLASSAHAQTTAAAVRRALTLPPIPLDRGGVVVVGGGWRGGRPSLSVRVGGVERVVSGRGTARGRASAGDAAGGAARDATGGAAAVRVLSTARRYVGVPYRWGGTSPRRGFDCSGYVQYVFARHGVRLPRTSRQQAHAGVRRATGWSAAAPGDLVMFAEPGKPISHVAIYVGRRRILHASASGGGVRYDDLDSRRGRWYRQRLVAVRRVTGRGPAITRGLLASRGLASAPLDPPDGAPRVRP